MNGGIRFYLVFSGTRLRQTIEPHNDELDTQNGDDGDDNYATTTTTEWLLSSSFFT